MKCMVALKRGEFFVAHHVGAIKVRETCSKKCSNVRNTWYSDACKFNDAPLNRKGGFPTWERLIVTTSGRAPMKGAVNRAQELSAANPLLTVTLNSRRNFASHWHLRFVCPYPRFILNVYRSGRSWRLFSSILHVYMPYVLASLRTLGHTSAIRLRASNVDCNHRCDIIVPAMATVLPRRSNSKKVQSSEYNAIRCLRPIQ